MSSPFYTVPFQPLKRFLSIDKTVKLRFLAPEGVSYETCILNLLYREIPKVICISSQLGCPFDCSFCEIGAVRYQRNLTKEEILGQVGVALEDEVMQGRSEPLEVAAMGTGEPLCALGEIVAAMRALRASVPQIISLNIATIGIPDKIYKYASTFISGLQLRLQLSLHATSDQERCRIMPRASRYRMQSVLDACSHFARVRSTRVVVNYLLLDHINDTLQHANRLAELLDPAYFSVKLSLPNPTSTGGPAGAGSEAFTRFLSILQSAGFESRVFTSAGVDIGAGCGQFSNKTVDKII